MSVVQNYLIFFMILTINLRDHSEYIMEIFKGNKSFFSKLVKAVCCTPNSKKRILLGMLSHVFLMEFRDCFFYKQNSEDSKNRFTAFSSEMIPVFNPAYANKGCF